LILLLISILFKESIISIERGINTWLRAICIRQSGRAPGSGSIEKIAESAVKTLERGVDERLGVEVAALLGAIVIEGRSPDCTLLMIRDQSAADSDAVE